MTQIDFHVNAADPLAYACRLARKGYGAGARMVFHSSDAGWLARFDRTLWTFSSLAFIPHCRASDGLANDTPIVLAGPADIDRAPHRDVLVNVDADVPNGYADFERMIEVVSSDPADLEAGRSRWKHYRDAGHALARHDLAASA